MDQKRHPSSQGLVVKNLVAVHADGVVYIGLHRDDWRKDDNYGPILLEGAMQLLVQYQPSSHGTVAMNSVPVPIAPADRPIDIEVVPSVYMDMSDDPKLGAMYSSLTGVSGLHLPSATPLPVNLADMRSKR